MSRRLRILFSFLFAACASLAAADFAAAREIDSEQTVTTEQIQLGQTLPQTLVVRSRADGDQIEVLHLNEALRADENSRQLVSTASFIKVGSDGRMIGELDRDSSSSSWIFRILPPPGGYGPGPVNRRDGPVSGRIPGDDSPGGNSDDGDPSSDNSPGETSDDRSPDDRSPDDRSPNGPDAPNDRSPDDETTPGGRLPGGTSPGARMPSTGSPGYGHGGRPSSSRTSAPRHSGRTRTPPTARRTNPLGNGRSVSTRRRSGDQPEYRRHGHGSDSRSSGARTRTRTRTRVRPHHTRHYRPRYSYRGYSYSYDPYYRYYHNGHYYEYYGWPYNNPYCRR